MNKISFGILFSAALMVFVSGFANAADFKYVGVKRCAMCHRGEKKGKMYEVWKESKHATAYETLGTDKAKEVAAKAGIEGDPQKSDQCISCHVTGHGEPEDAFMSSFKVEEGVTCENCHGPGSKYQKMSVMRDEAKFLANGGVVPKKESCLVCHNEKSPTYKGFEWERDYKKIEHHVPAK